MSDNYSKILSLSENFDDYTNGEIIRYNGKHKLKQENIAEHSFMVAINIIKVCKALSLPDNIRDKAVTMGILHDISEKYVGDIAFEFKSEEDNKEILAELFDDYEKKLYQNKYKSEYGLIYKDVYKGNNSIEDRLVKLADSMSVVQYSGREKVLGNTTLAMSTINIQAKIRVKYDYDRLLTALEEGGVNIG